VLPESSELFDGDLLLLPLSLVLQVFDDHI